MSTISDAQQLAVAPAAPLQFGSPLSAGPGTTVEGFGLADVLRVIKQRKLMIAIISVLLYMGVIAGTFITLKYFPAYPSSALFELDPPKHGVFVAEPGSVQPAQMEEMLQTEAFKLKQLTLLRSVVELPEFKQTEYYKWYEQNADKATVGLQDDVSAAPIPHSRLIRVALACRDKEEARLIVKKIVDKYLAVSTTYSRAQDYKELENIRKSLDNLREQIKQSRSQASQFRLRAEVPAMEMESMSSRDQLTILRSEISALETHVSSLQAQMDSTAGVDPDQLPLTAEQLMIVESDPILRYYKSQVENIDIELKVMLLRVGPNHRDVQIIKARQAGFYEKEAARREELIAKVRQREMEKLRQDLAQANNVMARRQEQLADAEAKQRDLDRNIQQYQAMVADMEALNQQIANLEKSETEAEHKVADDTRVRLRIVQEPQIAVKPSRPNLISYLGGGLLLSLAGGFGVAFLREFTDKAVRTPLDVVRSGHISVLGSVPLLDDEEADVEEMEDAVRKAPHSLIAEAFRRIRTNLQFSGPPETQRSLLFTSPSPGDGKTAVSINVAYTLAHSGQRVLLVDCNFRRPGIRAQFRNSRPEGLSNVLIGEGSFDKYVTKTELPNLDILTSGPMPPTPAELLGSQRMRAMIEDALKSYERVLLDGPPALLISDASVLAAQVDGVLFVSRADETMKGVLKRASEVFDAINARVVGAILNGVKARAGGYFRQQYREFYDYIDETVAIGELPEPRDNSDKGE